MAQVFIPASLRRYANGTTVVEVPGRTVRELVDGLEQRFPGLRDRLCDDDRLKPGLAVAVDSRISDLGLLQPVTESSEVHFVAAVSGG